MKQKKALSPVLLIIAIILGVTLYKSFDFRSWTFEKPALAVVYLITFVACVVVIIRDARK